MLEISQGKAHILESRGGLQARKQNAGGQRTYFVYDGDKAVLVLYTDNGNHTGSVISTATFGGNGLLSTHTTYGSSYFYTFDPGGSTCQSLTSTGTINYTSQVTAYGWTTSAGATADMYGGFGAQWGYRNENTGFLYLLGHRFYNAQFGQFMTRDPIGYGGGVNLYGYVGNDPVNEIDPDGYAPRRDKVGPIATFFASCIDVLAGLTGHHVPIRMVNLFPRKPPVRSPIQTGTYPTPGKGSGSGGSGGGPPEPGTPFSVEPGEGPGTYNPTGFFPGRMPGGGLGRVGPGALLGATSGSSDPTQAFGNGAFLWNTGGTRAPGDPGGCLVAGTLVLMADGSFKPIEKISVNDSVLTRFPETNQLTKEPVLNIEKLKVTTEITLYLSTGEHISISVNHPFYIVGRGYVHAKEITLGMNCESDTGKAVKIIGIERYHNTVFVYNIKTPESQTYFIGKSKIWVHK